MKQQTIITLDLPSVVYLQKRDWRLSQLFQAVGPLVSHKHDTAFQALAHSIIEQMLSMKAGRVIEDRLSAICSGNICPSTILALSIDEIRSCGMSKRKASNLRNLAEFARQYDLETLANFDDDAVRGVLLDLPGIGNWTCDMFLLFYLDRPDIVPMGDSAFRQAFQWLYGAPITNEGVREAICSLWHPYSSTAVKFLYRALNCGLTNKTTSKELFAHSSESELV